MDPPYLIFISTNESKFYRIFQDQGVPPQYSDTEVHVNVLDADDQNPKFASERYSSILPANPQRGTRLRLSPADLKAFDQDSGINAPVYYSFNSGTSTYFVVVVEGQGGILP